MATTGAAAPGGAQMAEDVGDDMTVQLARVDSELRRLVKERPVMALLGAVAVGYVVGRILRRAG